LGEEGRLGVYFDLTAGVLVSSIVILTALAVVSAFLPHEGEWRDRAANLDAGINLITAALLVAAALLTCLSRRVHGGLDRHVAARLQVVVAGLGAGSAVLAAIIGFAALSRPLYHPPLSLRLSLLGTAMAEILLFTLAACLVLLDLRRIGDPFGH
jgi:hypothetical protein